MNADPSIDLLELCELIGDWLISSFTTKELTYWQQPCGIQCIHEDVAEHNIDANDFTSPNAICNEIERILQECLFTKMLRLFDLKSKLIPQNLMKIFLKDIHNWVNNTSCPNLNEWIQYS